MCFNFNFCRHRLSNIIPSLLKLDNATLPGYFSNDVKLVDFSQMCQAQYEAFLSLDKSYEQHQLG